MREWEETLAKFDEEEGGAKQWDQNVFNDLFRRGMRAGEGGREEGEARQEGGEDDISSSVPSPSPSRPPPPRPDGLFPAYDNSLLFGILPVDLFASGHTFFVQRLPERTGAGGGLFGGEKEAEEGDFNHSSSPPSSSSGPFVVHATFQFSGDEGKRHRLRERYLWAVDDDDEDEGGRRREERGEPGDLESSSPSPSPSYYDPPGGLLLVEPPPPSVLGPAIAAAAAERERIRWMQRKVFLEEEEKEKDGSRSSDDASSGGGDGDSGESRNATAATTAIPTDPASLFSAHFTLVHLHLRSVVAGAALASALNRTLVLPKIWCGADRWFAPHLGSIPGAAGPLLPFRCPADHFLDLEMMSRIRRESLMAREEDERKVGGGGDGKGDGGDDDKSNLRLLFPPPPVREAGLLLNPRMPRNVNDDILHVVPCHPGQSGCDDGGVAASVGRGGWGEKKKSTTAAWRKKLWRASSSPSSAPSTLQLRSGLDNEHLVAALAPHSRRRVLSFVDPAASFGGFADQNLAIAFESSARSWASTWCCVARHPGHVWYDSFADKVPHVDRWGRGWDRPWAAVAGP